MSSPPRKRMKTANARAYSPDQIPHATKANAMDKALDHPSTQSPPSAASRPTPLTKLVSRQAHPIAYDEDESGYSSCSGSDNSFRGSRPKFYLLDDLFRPSTPPPSKGKRSSASSLWHAAENVASTNSSYATSSTGSLDLTSKLAFRNAEDSSGLEDEEEQNGNRQADVENRSHEDDYEDPEWDKYLNEVKESLSNIIPPTEDAPIPDPERFKWPSIAERYTGHLMIDTCAVLQDQESCGWFDITLGRIQRLCTPETSLGREGKVFVLKTYRFDDRSTQEAQHENRARKVQVAMELAAYRRIAAEVQEDAKVGLWFLMLLDAFVDATPKSPSIMVMEWLPGDLVSYIENGSLLDDEVPRLIAQIAVGIATLHSVGVLHRDIKPGNILVDQRRNARIMDFGNSWLNMDGRALGARQACVDTDAGSHFYKAPEIHTVSGVRIKYGPPVDYFSLGCVAYFLMTKGEDLFGESKRPGRPPKSQRLWNVNRDRRYLQLPDSISNDPDSLNLIIGLLEPDPKSRWGIEKLISADYFIREDERSEFDASVLQEGIDSNPDLNPLPPIENLITEELTCGRSIKKCSYWITYDGSLARLEEAEGSSEDGSNK